MTNSRTISRTAFTLIELVEDSIILGGVATLVVPRLIDRSGRSAELSARAMTELVSTLGTRSSLLGLAFALSFDDRRHRVVPESMVFAGSPGDFNTRPQWTRDPLLTAVTLEDLEVRRIVV